MERDVGRARGHGGQQLAVGTLDDVAVDARRHAELGDRRADTGRALRRIVERAELEDTIRGLISGYGESLPSDRRALVEQFEFVDMGSVTGDARFRADSLQASW